MAQVLEGGDPTARSRSLQANPCSQCRPFARRRVVEIGDVPPVRPGPVVKASLLREVVKVPETVGSPWPVEKPASHHGILHAGAT